MITLKASRDLRPISDLKSSGADIVRQVNQTGRPVVLTRHGRGVAVLLTVEQYEHLYERLEEVERRLAAVEGAPVREGEDDVREKVERWARGGGGPVREGSR